MINPDAEVDRLRHMLIQGGYDISDAYTICDAVSDDINELMLDIAANAMTEATEYAGQIGAEEFIDDMDVVPYGGIFMITTRSRKTNYSESERKMLPSLLSNAKRATDGSMYKVIPITDKKRSNIPNNMFELLRDQRRQQVATRNTMVQELKIGRSKGVGSMQERLRAMITNSRNSRKMFYTMSRPSVVTGDTVFRTASSKQYADTSWVRPARKLDMTGYLMDLNNKIDRVLFDSVRFLVRSYQEEYL